MVQQNTMTPISITPKGGSELLYASLLRHLGQDWPAIQSRVNLILSICASQLLDPDPNRINVVWQHLMTDQPATFKMRDAEFVSQVSSFVYVSDWQLAQFRDMYNIEHVQNTVIRNAIEPIPFVPKPKGKIKLVYTSMPDRGLDILLDAFALIEQGRDVVLDVYSSNIIYGAGYASGEGQKNNDVLNKCRKAHNVNYRGYVTNKAIRLAMQRAHILAYPSTFEETSCLSAIEAGCAGCKIVTTDLGALPETCGSYATYVYNNKNQLVERYARALANAIDEYYSIPDSLLVRQSNWFNERYSWDNRIQEWRDFFNTFQKG